jgi:ABC-type transport system substrate-binding protein
MFGMTTTARSILAVAAMLVATVSALSPRLAAAAEGQMSFAAHVTLAPRWLDPAETESAITPFMVLYAIHDAMVKPMPGGLTTPSLAESWTVHQIQRILHDKVIFAPIWENGFIRGVTARAEEPALTLIPAFPYAAPLEELRVKK